MDTLCDIKKVILSFFMLTLSFLFAIIFLVFLLYFGGVFLAKVKVQITVEEELLRKVEQYADDNYISRSGVFVQGAAQIVSQAEVMALLKSMSFAMKKIADTGSVDDDTYRQLEDFQRALTFLCGAS